MAFIKIFKINSLTKKILMAMIIIGLAILILIYVFLPNVFYISLKDRTVNDALKIGERASEQIDQETYELDLYAHIICDNKVIEQMLKEYFLNGNEEIKYKINNALTDLFFVGAEKVLSVMLVMEDGTVFTSVGRRDPVQANEKWFLEYKTSGYPRQYSNILEEEDYRFGKSICFATPYHAGNLRGDIVFTYNFSSIQKALHSYSINGYTTMLFNRDNKLIYPLEEENTDVEPRVFEKLQESDFIYQTKFETDSGLYIISKMSLGGLKIVSYASRENLIAPYENVFYFVYIMILTFFALFCITVIPIIIKSIIPLRELKNKMKTVASGNLEVSVDVNSGDEIEELANAFNYMAEKLKINIEKMMTQEREAEYMKYAMLISQIKPHFIYNTLNTITFLAMKKNTDDIVVVNKALISILKNNLTTEIKNFETIDNELFAIRQYMVIQEYRYGSGIELVTQVDDELLTNEIPKNIIQPLVENAIFHGLAPLRDEDGRVTGRIVVSIRRDDEMLILTVRDTGIGMDQATIDKYFERDEWHGRHIGIYNIKNRLSYLYNDKLTMNIKSGHNLGTSIELVFPCEYEE